MPRKLLPLLVCIACLAASAPAPVHAAEVVDRVVAVVNGEMVTLGELNARARTILEQAPASLSAMEREQLQRQLLERLLDLRIGEILMRQEAQRLKVEVDTVEIENRLREYRENNNLTEEAMQAQLAVQGKTRAQLVEEIRQELLKNKLLGYMVHRKVVVTDEEVQAYLRSGGAVEASPAPSAPAPSVSGKPQGKVRLELILVNDAATAKKLRDEVAGKKLPFAEAARKHSVGPNAAEGGDMGLMSLGELAPAIRKAAEGLSPGELSQLFQLESMHGFVRMAESSPGGGAPAAPAPAPSMKPAPAMDAGQDLEAVRAQLHKQKLEKIFQEYMDKLKAKALIKINW